MGNKLTKSSAILMTALTLGTSALTTAQLVANPIVASANTATELDKNNYTLKAEIDTDNITNPNESVSGKSIKIKITGTLKNGDAIKNGDIITLKANNLIIKGGPIKNDKDQQFGVFEQIASNNAREITNSRDEVLAGTRFNALTDGAPDDTYQIRITDASKLAGLKDINFTYETLTYQLHGSHATPGQINLELRDNNGTLLAQKMTARGVSSPYKDETDLTTLASQPVTTDRLNYDVNTNSALVILNTTAIYNKMLEPLKKGSIIEWTLNDPNFTYKLLNMQHNTTAVPVTPDMIGQIFDSGPTAGRVHIEGQENKLWKVNPHGVLGNLTKGFKFRLLEANNGKAKIELLEDATHHQYLRLFNYKATLKKVDDTTIDPATGQLKNTFNTSVKITQPDGKVIDYVAKRDAVYSGVWSNANGQIVKKSSTQLIGQLPGGVEVPITATDPMEAGTPYTLKPKPTIVANGNIYRVKDPSDRTGKTDPNVPKIYAPYELVGQVTTATETDPTNGRNTTTVTTKAPTTTKATTSKPTSVSTSTRINTVVQPATTNATTSKPTTVSTSTRISTVVQPATTKPATTTVTPKKVTTYFKDPSGKDIIPPSEGDKPKVDIPGYTYIGTTTDPDGNVVHNYKPTPKDEVVPKKVTTYFKDDKGNEVKPPVDGDQPKLDIPGYEYVGTETDPDGNVIHKYRKVEVTSAKESKPLPKTGDASSLIGLIGTGLASVIGLVNFKRKK